MNTTDALEQLADVIDGRHPDRGGDPATSYIARLLGKGSDAVLKKVGEEATEVVMAAKDLEHGGDRARLVGEVADLWFHSMIALSMHGLRPSDVVAELRRREGQSGLDEKALRKVAERESDTPR
jgi:phosphoribosyl-ATP pyrophosphohydrolase